MLWPSTVTFNVAVSIPSAMLAAQLRNLQTSLPKNGGSSRVEHSTLRVGKRIAFPAGTTQPSRVTAPTRLPARKNTGPFGWSLPHSTPERADCGFSDKGIARAHCHQAADQSPYVRPNTTSLGGKTSWLRSRANARGENTMASPTMSPTIKPTVRQCFGLLITT